jgi:hypothetical protein
LFHGVEDNTLCASSQPRKQFAELVSGEFPNRLLKKPAGGVLGLLLSIQLLEVLVARVLTAPLARLSSAPC